MNRAFLLLIFCFRYLDANPPNIVIIIADDLGWNDFGFHGSNEISTPNVDAFAYNGLILQRHYTSPSCTPSRAALLTGKYPIRYGLQGNPLAANEPAGLDKNEKVLPQYLKELGYATRLVGKWHLGFHKVKYTPTRRGFDSFFGFYTGFIRYFGSNHCEISPLECGFDARENLERAGHKFENKYVTNLFSEEAVKIIKEHNVSTPLFLQLAHVAVHADIGGNLDVENVTENDNLFGYIRDTKRRTFAGALASFDKSVGRVMAALDEKRMLKNSIVVIVSDNGAPTEGVRYSNAGSNWPLRGIKFSLMEGGVRGAATIWSPFTSPNTVLNGLIHITDWLPTLYAAAGGNVSDLGHIDGINQWEYLTGEQKTSSRNEMLINIDKGTDNEAIIVDDWKYVKANNVSVMYLGSAGRKEAVSYDLKKVLRSDVNAILSKYSNFSAENKKAALFKRLRNLSVIDNLCGERINVIGGYDNTSDPTFCNSGCLFNIQQDPCEFHDLLENETEIASALLAKLKQYRKYVFPSINRERDPMANPKLWDNYWTFWDSKWPHMSSARLSNSFFFLGCLSIVILYCLCIL